jgi:hypothetical protein
MEDSVLTALGTYTIAVAERNYWASVFNAEQQRENALWFMENIWISPISYLIAYLITHFFTYLLTYLLYGAESFLRI